jgi:hypothetical protein
MHASRGRRKPGPKLSERKRGYVWLFGLKRAFCDARFFYARVCPVVPGLGDLNFQRPTASKPVDRDFWRSCATTLLLDQGLLVTLLQSTPCLWA